MWTQGRLPGVDNDAWKNICLAQVWVKTFSGQHDYAGTCGLPNNHKGVCVPDTRARFDHDHG